MSREPQQTEWLNGRIDAAKIAELASKVAEIASADEYLICGPGDMVDSVRGALKALNDKAQIRFERFATGVPGTAGAAGLTSAGAAAPRTGIAIPADEPALATITVVMLGQRRRSNQQAKYRGRCE